jgi:hypothetical protein
MKRKGYVRYVAPTQFNTRTLTKQDWESLGVTDQDAVHWGPETNWKVPADRFSDAAWPVIEGESSLVHEGGDDDSVEMSEPVARATAAPGRQRGGR